MTFEYNMSETMAKELLKTRKGNERKMDTQKYLINYINEQFNLRVPVTKVYTTL